MTRPTSIARDWPASASIVWLDGQGTLPASLPCSVVASCKEALAEVTSGEPGRWHLRFPADRGLEALALALAGEAGVPAEVVSGEEAEWRAVADVRLTVYVGESPIAPTTTGHVANRWLAVSAIDGQRSEIGATRVAPTPAWLADILARAGVTLSDDVARILDRSNALVRAAEREARRSRRIMVAVEVLCVLLPLVWLLRMPMALPPRTAALLGLASPVLILAFGWWHRRQNPERIRRRAALLAEACRSWLATQQAPARPLLPLLSGMPALRPLLRKFVAEPRHRASTWRADYLRDRIDHARVHGEHLRDQALRGHERATRWRRWLLEVSLTMGIAGLLVSLHPRSASWLTQLGGTGFDLVFSLAGLALPLGLLAARSLQWVDPSMHRSGHHARRLQQLDHFRERFEGASDDTALQLMHDTESLLLSEVADAYWQTASDEEIDTPPLQSSSALATGRAPKGGARRAPRPPGGRGLGDAAGVGLRVLLGSLASMALGAALVLMWISFKQPETAEVGSRLRELGRMRDPWTGEAFTPQPMAADHGTLVIAHGMRDGWHRVYPGSDLACAGARAHWSTEIAEQIRRRSGALAPQMIVLDWSEGAKPSSRHGLSTGDPVTRFLADLGGMTSSAEITGDFFGIRLARMMDNGQIRRDRPLQLIGHSAGGFVMVRAAQIIVAMGFPKEQVHVTLLDTPEPGLALSQEGVQFGAIEFYRTSNLTRVAPGDLGPTIHYAHIALPDAVSTSEKAAHDYAPDWYCQTAVSAPCGQDGFGRSPFCR